MHRFDLRTVVVASALLVARASAHAGNGSQLAFTPDQPMSGPHMLISPPCLGTQLQQQLFNSIASVPINDFATCAHYITVSGMGEYLYDVDASVFITHSYNADLTIRLTSPMGTTVTLAKGQGGSYDDVYTGTKFDDSKLGVPITDYVFANHSTATTLNPVGSLDTLRGQNPNGVWKLEVSDGSLYDTGTFWSCALDVATLPAPPMLTSNYATNTQPTYINDGATVWSSVQLSGLPTTMDSLYVFTDIDHSSADQLTTWLQSPQGTIVFLVSNEQSPTNCFHGTAWYESEDNADMYFYNGGPAPSVAPIGSFGAFRGEDPNGTWTLYIHDGMAGNQGVLNSWWLQATTCHGSLETYCPSGTSWTNNCNAQMQATGVCSASKTSGFVLLASQVEAHRTGLIFYGESGRQMTPWHPNMNTQLCVKAPTQRTIAQDSGGIVGATCSGEISVDWLAFMHNNPGALGHPLTPGTLVQAQCWYRDPASPKTTNLSDAIEFSVIP